MSTQARKLRNNAVYLRHLADVAERDMTPAQLEAERVERVAAESGEDGYDTNDVAHWPLLPEALRLAAKVQYEAANALEDAEELLEHAQADYKSNVAAAQKWDWYDEAYEGFCDSAVAA